MAQFYAVCNNGICLQFLEEENGVTAQFWGNYSTVEEIPQLLVKFGRMALLYFQEILGRFNRPIQCWRLS